MKVKVKVINCLFSKCRKKGFFINLNPFLWRVAEDGKKNTNMVIKKKYLLLIPKPIQMMNINVKVNVKVTNGTFSKKAKNSNLGIF